MKTLRAPRPSTASPTSLKGYLLLALAVVTCPCHLPILLAIVAGTGLAGVLSQYFGAVLAVMSVVFVVSLLLSLKILREPEEKARRLPEGQDPPREP